MMVKVSFGRNKYSLHSVRVQWLEDIVGKYNWGNKPSPGNKWSYVEAFGYHDYYFVDESSATLFILVHDGFIKSTIIS